MTSTSTTPFQTQTIDLGVNYLSDPFVFMVIKKYDYCGSIGIGGKVNQQKYFADTEGTNQCSVKFTSKLDDTYCPSSNYVHAIFTFDPIVDGEFYNDPNYQFAACLAPDGSDEEEEEAESEIPNNPNNPDDSDDPEENNGGNNIKVISSGVKTSASPLFWINVGIRIWFVASLLFICLFRSYCLLQDLKVSINSLGAFKKFRASILVRPLVYIE